MTDDEAKAKARRRRTLLQMAVVLAWAIWATLPPEELALGTDCQPIDGPSSVSAFLYGKWFWHRQLDAEIVEANRLLAEPAQREMGQDEERMKVDDRMNHLNRDDIRNANPEQRERREEADQTKRLLRLAWLAQCRATIEATMGETAPTSPDGTR